MHASALLSLITDLHQGDADDDPDDFADTADDADKEALLDGQAHCCRGNSKASFLYAELHGKETYQVGKQRGKRDNKDAVKEGEGDAIEPSATIYAEKKEHEEHFGTLHDTREVLKAQGCIEVLATLLMQGSDLCIHIMQGFCMRFEESVTPSSEPRQMAQPANQPHDESVPVSPIEEVEGNQAEDDDDAKHDGNCRIEGQVANQRECKVEENRREPEPEVRKDVEHRIKDDRGGGVLLRDVLAQLHDAVRFSTETTNRSGIVEGITRDGQLVDSPKTDGFIGICITLDDRHPRESIDAIHHYPDAHDGDEPPTCTADVAPKLNETDVEREEHHHDTNDAEEEEEIIPTPLHAPSLTFSATLRQNASCRRLI